MLLDLISKKEKQIKPFDINSKVEYALGIIGCGLSFNL